jgi:hypothetical protein
VVSIPKRLVYVDESGHPGFAMGRGSTPVFVVVAILFDSAEDAGPAGGGDPR